MRKPEESYINYRNQQMPRLNCFEFVFVETFALIVMNNNSFVCGLLVQLLKLDNEYERLDKLPSGTLCSISIELSIEQTIR